jgi:hypothetical protein
MHLSERERRRDEEREIPSLVLFVVGIALIAWLVDGWWSLDDG